MCIFWSCLLLKWFGECSKTVGTWGSLLVGVVQMYCIALQSRWRLVSTAVGVSSRKLPRTESLYTVGLILHTLLMKLLLCLTVSCIAVICHSFCESENWLCLKVTAEDQLEYCVSVFVVIAGVDFIVWAPLSPQWIALTAEKKNIQASSCFV